MIRELLHEIRSLAMKSGGFVPFGLPGLSDDVHSKKWLAAGPLPVSSLMRDEGGRSCMRIRNPFMDNLLNYSFCVLRSKSSWRTKLSRECADQQSLRPVE